MREEHQIALVFLITLCLGVVGSAVALAFPVVFEPDLVISGYEADINWDGTLDERYQYNVKESGEYRSLNRKFDDSLFLKPVGTPFIQFVSSKVPKGTTAYVRDSQSVVTLPAEPEKSVPDAIRSHASAGEMGAYNPSYYNEGLYDVEYHVKMFPPIEYDNEYAHMNIKLASEHIPYKDIRITFPEKYVEKVYPHPDTLDVETENGRYLITGSVAEDQNLGVELLLSPDFIDEMPGFPVFTEDVKGMTEAANFAGFSLVHMIVLFVLYAAIISAVLLPFVLIAIWYIFGREKQFTVPDNMSFIPNKELMPWMVNLIFKGDAVSFDDEGFYATLLDLHRKGNIAIKTKPDDNIEISVLDLKSSDSYEKDVLGFLYLIAEDGVVDTSVISSLAKTAGTDKSAQSVVLRYQNLLTDLNSVSDEALVNKYVINGRGYLFPFLGIGILGGVVSFILMFIFSPFFAELLSALILWAIVAVQAGVGLAFPATLFGKWKGDYYKEKLEWDAFTAFLSDFAQMSRYGTEDLNMWGEWLIYGTALGVGDSVASAMEKLDIKLSFCDESPSIYRRSMSHAFIPVMAYSTASSSGSGGSFGGGGGFGGGGAGGW